MIYLNKRILEKDLRLGMSNIKTSSNQDNIIICLIRVWSSKIIFNNFPIHMISMLIVNWIVFEFDNKRCLFFVPYYAYIFMIKTFFLWHFENIFFQVVLEKLLISCTGIKKNKSNKMKNPVIYNCAIPL